ncbi:MAG: HD domain-containing protein [Theionarchaea archaeon]|nr:HD domain-containing protein [Theionarchaea archaeon]
MHHVIDFIQAAERLKDIFRTGWKLSGVDHPESVADHSYCVAVLAMILGDMLNLDTEKMMRMALLHDLIESKLGDIHYEGRIYLGERALAAAEENAARDLLTGEYLEVWEEYCKAQSREAQIVSACDKLELYFQAIRYEKTGYKGLEHFWENPWNRKDFTPEIMELFELIKKLRNK